MRTVGVVASARAAFGTTVLFDDFSTGSVYLDSTIGPATTPDNAAYTIASTDDFVITSRVRKYGSWTGVTEVVCAHGNATPQISWAFYLTGGTFAFSWGSGGSSYAQTTGVFDPVANGWLLGIDYWIGVKFDRTATNVTLTAIGSSDGVTWSNIGPPQVLTTTQTFLNSTDAVSIGSRATSFVWNGFIHNAEMRLGLVPGSGTQLWRFNASEYPGSGTSYTDPRGLAWTVPSAAAIQTSVDSSKWDVYNRISDQVNSEVNCCAPANVTISGGTLKITGRHEDHICGDTTTGAPNPRTFPYTSGQIAQRSEFLYGRVDVRMKLNGGIGFWPCVWMLGNGWHPTQMYSANDPGSFPENQLGEIDIAEFMGNSRTAVNCQIHYNSGSGHVDPGGFVALGFDATTKFAVYRCDWSAGSAIMSVDEEIGTGFRVLQTISGSTNVPSTPMYFILNMAVGGNGGGTPDPATFPQFMEIDYVRITQ